MALRFVSLSLFILMTTLTTKSTGAFVFPSKSFLTRTTTRTPPNAATDKLTVRHVSQIPTTTDIGIDDEYLPCPYSEYTGSEVITMCMNALQANSQIYNNAGLEVCYNFASDLRRAAWGSGLEGFIKNVSNSVFSSMVECQEWSLEKTGPLIAGTPTRGAMQTALVRVMPDNGKERTFLWTLQRERRPPRQNCWLVHECISIDNAYALTL